ncbi:MAG: ABC transporter substrate-binding protein [Janthinobacterium lividum]
MVQHNNRRLYHSRRAEDDTPGGRLEDGVDEARVRRMTLALGRRGFAGLAGAALLGTRVRAATSSPIRIGVLSALSGPYTTISGIGALAAVKLAIEDFHAEHPDAAVETVSGDIQDKADIGAAVARDWFDRGGVDVITDVPNTAVALAVTTIASDKNKVLLVSGGTAAVTGRACTPNHLQWSFDTGALVAGTVKTVAREGAGSWFFITADYSFGQSMQEDATRLVEASGGKTLGYARYPFPQTTDFSSFILTAQASGASVICLANGGIDAINCYKQCREFGILPGGPQRVVALGMTASDLDALGPELAQGLINTEAYHWDFDEPCRSFAKRFAALTGGLVPGHLHAGNYSAVRQYLRAVMALGVDRKSDGRAVMAQIKAMPFDDPLFGPGYVRADGHCIHRLLVLEAKGPKEVRYPNDFQKLVQVIPPDQAFPPLSASACPLVRT